MQHKNVSPSVRLRILFERRMYPRDGGDTCYSLKTRVYNVYDIINITYRVVVKRVGTVLSTN